MPNEDVKLVVNSLQEFIQDVVIQNEFVTYNFNVVKGGKTRVFQDKDIHHLFAKAYIHDQNLAEGSLQDFKCLY